MDTTTNALLSEDADTSLSAQVNGDDLWVAAPDLSRVTGWKLAKAASARDTICTPFSASLSPITAIVVWPACVQCCGLTGGPS